MRRRRRTGGMSCSASHGGRSDLFLRGFLRKRDDGLGPGLDLTVARTAFERRHASSRASAP